MAGSGSSSNPGSSDLPDTGTRGGWTPDGDINHGFGIVEEDGNYSDEDF